ncbi:unnamed protein product [Mytilus coruscus]|uniref:EGF-like domain-containing protein n=1 Tax=Mytilus coruscus TaxID=42192 RepID=A0A6J8DES1_MYTCO|nr:unnamed protein product [Mytilus coruscus]
MFSYIHIDIDECAKNKDNCDRNNQICVNEPGTFKCKSCPPGKLPVNNKCEVKTCQHIKCGDHQVCKKTAEGPKCKCVKGYYYTGTRCKDIDECAKNKDNCDRKNQICVNELGTFKCKSCPPGKIPVNNKCEDYADVIYDNCSSADSANIEHVQRRVCIISTGAIRVTKHVTLLKEVGHELLKTRRKVHRLTYLYKIKNHPVPDYLRNFHPLFHHNTENNNLRRHANLIPIWSRTVAYYNSFLLATIKDWNSLSAERISATSLASFKRLLKKNLNLCSKKIYSRGHGYEKKIHTRLRLGLSALNDHLYKNNLTLNRFCNFCQAATKCPQVKCHYNEYCYTKTGKCYPCKLICKQYRSKTYLYNSCYSYYCNGHYGG